MMTQRSTAKPGHSLAIRTRPVQPLSGQGITAEAGDTVQQGASCKNAPNVVKSRLARRLIACLCRLREPDLGGSRQPAGQETEVNHAEEHSCPGATKTSG